MPFLKHIVNGSPVGFIELVDSITIGRNEENDIVVADPTVSGCHVDIRKQNNTWVLHDKGSTNGTSVKGKKIDTLELTVGTTFSFGTQNFEFCDGVDFQSDKTLKIQKSWIPGIYFTK